MSVRFTQDVEKDRLANREKPKWGLFSSGSIVAAVHFARDNGWAEKKVQVRFEADAYNTVEYTVEPFDDCKCPNILKYKDFFLDEQPI